MHNPQLNAQGELTHPLTTDGLPRAIMTQILDTAESFMEISTRAVKKVPLLRGKSVFNLFFENSTRTRTTFEIAATRLSADVINLDIARSSASKGESLSHQKFARHRYSLLPLLRWRSIWPWRFAPLLSDAFLSGSKLAVSAIQQQLFR